MSTPPETFVDLLPDELSLARAQLGSGLAVLAEGVLRRHIARLEASGRTSLEEVDAARSLLAESLWRQGRPHAAGAVIDAIRAGSIERRRPITMLIEAESLAAGGDPDRARALMERVVAAVGVDEAWRLRGGVASRLPWPVPPSLRAGSRRATSPAMPTPAAPPSPERIAAAHGRVEAARQAYGSDHPDVGDRELGLALRLDPGIAADGVDLLEPTLGSRAAADRLLLYGDLLRAAGRPTDAADAYDRAARS